MAELSNWKIAASSSRDDPDCVTNAFEMMNKTEDPDQKDIEAVLQVLLFDSTERDMIRRAGLTQVEGQVASGVLQGLVE